MPTYDLRCRACGQKSERFVLRMLTDDDLVCPVCGSRDVIKGIGGGFVSVARPSSGGSAGVSCSSTRFR